jgi:hypothetical protein
MPIHDVGIVFVTLLVNFIVCQSQILLNLDLSHHFSCRSIPRGNVLVFIKRYKSILDPFKCKVFVPRTHTKKREGISVK